MMEESKITLKSSPQPEDKNTIDLEKKIKLMWETIQDLKQKVADEKELLKKEKSENEKMVEEQNKLRRKLSMFHLPHCPAYMAPCPVHSVKPYSCTHSEQGQELLTHDLTENVFQGDHELQSYEDLVLSLQQQVGPGNEDLFADCETSVANSIPQHLDPTSFTLSLSDQWQDRWQSADRRREQPTEQKSLLPTTPGVQQNEDCNVMFGDAKFSN